MRLKRFGHCTGNGDTFFDRMRNDEPDIKAVCRTIQSFNNPFCYEGENLVSLMFRVVASSKAQNDRLLQPSVEKKQLRNSLTNKSHLNQHNLTRK